MKPLLAIIAILPPTLLVGCAGLRPSRPDVARYRAEGDFSCKQVEVTEQEAVGAKSVFAATGCSKSGVYVVHCSAGAGCQAYSEAEWAKKDSRLTGKSVTYSVLNACRDAVHLNDTGNDRKFTLAPGGKELIVGVVGDELQLTDTTGNVLQGITITEADRSLQVTNACVTRAH